MSFYVSTATFFLLHCDEWDCVVALPRHKFVTRATLLQLYISLYKSIDEFIKDYNVIQKRSRKKYETVKVKKIHVMFVHNQNKSE